MKNWLQSTFVGVGLLALVTLGCAQPVENQVELTKTVSEAPAEVANATKEAEESTAAPTETENASTQVFTLSVPGMS